MNGIILINKEKGISSFGVVAKIRKICNTKKVGHCGTLDPMATGVLPIMVGNATKLSKYLVEHNKEYVTTIKIGEKTDSADSEGKIIEKDDFRLVQSDEKKYIEIIRSFVGKSKQIPPMFSAIKINGKKLYEYAREGIEIERKSREIELFSIDNISIDYEENEITFKVACSKGTYIRTLCEDIAGKIGTIGYMKNLERTKLEKFDISKSIRLSELEKAENKNDYIISIDSLFENKPQIILDDRKKELFLNGVKLSYDLSDDIYRVYNKDVFIGLGEVHDKLLKRDVIL